MREEETQKKNSSFSLRDEARDREAGERIEIQELTTKVQPARDERGASKLINKSSSGEGAEIQKLTQRNSSKRAERGRVSNLIDSSNSKEGRER